MKAWLLGALLAGALAAGCTGDDDDASPAVDATPATAATTEPTAGGAASDTPAATSTREADHPVVEVIVRGADGREHVVRAEVVHTSEDRQRGLMFREELGEDEGMLFLFPDDRQGGFWMENTYLPLDIAYIDASGEIVDVIQGEPLDQTLLVPDGEYRYVLEMNAGWFAGRGLGVGDTVEIPEGLPAPE